MLIKDLIKELKKYDENLPIMTFFEYCDSDEGHCESLIEFDTFKIQPLFNKQVLVMSEEK